MTEKKKRFFESMYEILDRENGRKLQMYGIIDLLNEQDEKIKELEKENEKLKEELNNLKKDETMLYHYYTLSRYSGDGV